MKWLKRQDREPPVDLDPGPDDPDTIEQELMVLKARKQQENLPPPDRDLVEPGRADLHPVDEDEHQLDKRVIDLHPYALEEEERHLPRTLKSKIFGIGPSGYFQLTILCIVVGAIFTFGAIDPFAPGFNVETLVRGMGTGALSLLGWVLETGWWPVIVGAVLVVPVWIVWRVHTVPFRH
jgi:hypothetical protein